MQPFRGRIYPYRSDFTSVFVLLLPSVEKVEVKNTCENITIFRWKGTGIEVGIDENMANESGNATTTDRYHIRKLAGSRDFHAINLPQHPLRCIPSNHDGIISKITQHTCKR